MTAQVPESLHVGGRHLNLCAVPLYKYLVKLSRARRPRFFAPTTACHRGYVGQWLIENGKFLLADLHGYVRSAETVVEADLKSALPWLKAPAHATWFTGELRCPEGRLVEYAHNMFMSTYERDRIFIVERGMVLGQWVRLNPPSSLIYCIGADGLRTCVSRIGSTDDVVDDPLAPDDELEGYKAWGKPPQGNKDYVVAAYVDLLALLQE